MVSGGAPLNPEIGSFFLALGRAAAAGLRPDRGRAGGELPTRPTASRSTRSARRSTGSRSGSPRTARSWSPATIVMKGYWNDPEATARTLARRLAAHRRYRHARRRRLSPDHRPQARLHQEFRRRHDLAGAGRGRLDPAAGDRPGDGVRRPPALSRRGDRAGPGVRRAASRASRASSRSSPTLADDPELAKAVGAAVARVNAELSPIERVRRFIIAREPFTIANGQMTPTLKIKRHAIRQAYGEALVGLYETKAA